MRTVILLALLVPLLAGCGRAARDFEDLCHAEERSGAKSIVNPVARAHAITTWTEQRMRTRSAQETLAAVAAMADAEARKGVLLKAAREAGYTGPCPMFEPRR